MENNILEIIDCMGCYACQNVCPKKCISFKKNKEGFYFPSVDETKCISCGICKGVCPQESEEKKEFREVYGIRVKDDDILYKSTSGGFFSILSDIILENDGYVCGAVFDSNYRVVHIVTNKSYERNKMRGAKYVQSNMGEVLPTLIKLIKMGNKVLFVGTPCQVTALKNILNLKKINMDSLITVDIICHGVPSPGLFEEHIKDIISQHGEIKEYLFRSKKIGWRGQNVIIETVSGMVPDNEAKVFSKLYFNSLISRPCCANCKFASLKRCGDFTIGDFWGIQNENPYYDDNKGVSMVMINSEKASIEFEKIKNYAEYFKVVSNNYIQPNMIHPTEESKLKKMFWKKYEKKGFSCSEKFLKLEPSLMLVVRAINKLKKIC